MFKYNIVSDEDNSDSEPNFFEDLEIVYYHSEIQMYYGEQHSDGYIEYIISFSATIEQCYQFLFEIFFNLVTMMRNIILKLISIFENWKIDSYR